MTTLWFHKPFGEIRPESPAQRDLDSICAQCRSLKLEDLPKVLPCPPTEPDPSDPKEFNLRFHNSFEVIQKPGDPLNHPSSLGDPKWEKEWTLMGTWHRPLHTEGTVAQCHLCELFMSSTTSEHSDWFVCAGRKMAFRYAGPRKDWFMTLEDKELRTSAKAVSWLLFLSTSYPIVHKRDILSGRVGDILRCKLGRSHTFCASLAPHNSIHRHADVRKAREYYEYCRLNHRNCSVDAKKVPDMRIIECRTRAVVVPPDDCKYAALSYPWGKEAMPACPSSGPSKFPKTIMDAISVCLDLGLNYLWVDRYCINQMDSVHKQQQIAHMHRIYRQADITIIARAGANPEYGLAGVDKTPRRGTPVCFVGDVEIYRDILLGTHPHCVWERRSWTLQEACLSRRRLAFTDSQLVFDCAQSVCREVHFGGDVAQLMSQRFHQYDGDFLLTEKKNEDDNIKRFHALLENFRSRELTHESDSIDAFMGICQEFASFVFPIHSVWGLPVIADQRKPSPYSDAQYFEMSLCRALSWTPRTSTASKSVMRQLGFPSWCWSGWSGGLNCYYGDAYPACAGIELEYEAEGRISTQELIPLLRLGGIAYTRPKLLHLRTYAVSPQCLVPWPPHADGDLFSGDFARQPHVHRSYWAFETVSSYRVYLEVFSPGTSEEEAAQKLKSGQWRVLIIIGEEANFFGMVIEKKATREVFERIGHVKPDFRGLKGQNTLLDEVVNEVCNKLHWYAIA